MSDAPQTPADGKRSGDRKALSAQSGFWRRAAKDGSLHKSDVFHLREDLKRMEELVDQASTGCASAEWAEEMRQVQETLAKDYMTQALVQQTLIEILIEKGIMTDDEFIDKLDEIDLRDGVRDGMLHPKNAETAEETGKDET